MGVVVKFPHVIRDRPADLLISGLDRIEPMGGGLLRLVLFINHTRADGTIERLAADFDVVMPAEALTDAIAKALVAAGRAVFVGDDGDMTLQ